MTTFGIDCAANVTHALPALKQVGVKFVCRYIAPVGKQYDWKRITPAEAKAITAAGLELVVVFESSANRALSGRGAGLDDARSAQASLTALGYPEAAAYFAMDFDVPDAAPTLTDPKAKLGPAAAYFQGILNVMPLARVGVYGGYWAVKRCFDGHLVSYGWQTYAWSGGQWDPRSHIRQYLNGQKMGGLSVDFDRAYQVDYGQVHGAPPKPVPPPKPKPPPPPSPGPPPVPLPPPVPPPPPVPAPPSYDKATLREQLRLLVLRWKADGGTWGKIKKTRAYQLWRSLGGK